MCTKLEIVTAKTADEFQKAFNSKMSELESKDPVYEFNHSAGFCAYIIYSEKDEFIGRVEPPNDVICDSCLRRVEEPRPRCKWRKCALYGAITKTNPVCDDYIPRRS